MNPAGQTPVLADDKGIDPHRFAGDLRVFRGDDRALADDPGTAVDRAEVRRLIALLDDKLYREVVGPLLDERMKKRLVSRDPPDTRVLRDAMRIANGHLDYLDYLLDHRRWLAGPVLSLAILPPRRICRSPIISAASTGAATSRPWNGIR
jgi:glutathione S-transferase